MTKKILLIDDSSTQLELMKNFLVSSGFDVCTAKDGAEGYKAVFSNAPDLILSDILMPNLNGFQLCRLLKNSDVSKKIPIILLTVLDKNIDIFWANKSGADKFISKASSFKEITDAIASEIANNPISMEYKEALLQQNKTSESIQNEISNIFDELLMNSTFLSEFRELYKYIGHEEVLIEETLKLLGSFVDYDVAGIFMSNPDKNEKYILNLDIKNTPLSKFVIEKIKRDFFTKIVNNVEYSPKDFSHNIVKDADSENGLILDANQFKTSFFFPFFYDEKLSGGICFYKLDEYNYMKNKFYQNMIEELSLLLKFRYIYLETEYSSVTDGLTGLYNRRHFESNLEREFLRVRRYHSELSLAMIDIDFFKKINDSYGHQYGDYVLKEIANILQESFRKTDMIYRYGGEELVIMLPETSINNAFIPLERIREKIADKIFEYNGISTHVTISVGIGCYNDKIVNHKMLLESSDEALYKAKQNGRNRVIIADYE